MADADATTSFAFAERVRPLIGYVIQVGALLLSFVAGSATGSVAAYINVRRDLATLDARVTIGDERITSIEGQVQDWRKEDRAFDTDIQGQLVTVTNLLTDLRIQMGPHRR